MECAYENNCHDELDHLEGIQLRSFNEKYDSIHGLLLFGSVACPHSEEQTPSSGTTLLPTPNESQFPLAPEAGQGSAPPIAVWEPFEMGLKDEDEIPMPAAPRMKDLDSFTEGTGAGSFDFLSSHSDEVLFPPLDEAYLAALNADPADHTESINSWRQDVSQHEILREQITDHFPGDFPPCASAEPSTSKRPRSITSSDTGRKRLKPSTTRSIVLPLRDDTPSNGMMARERRNSAPPVLRGICFAAATPQPHSKQL